MDELKASDILSLCMDNEIVLGKAKEFGIFPILSSMKEGDTLKVTYADEKINIGTRKSINAYAFVNFGNHHPDPADNGFAYLKF